MHRLEARRCRYPGASCSSAFSARGMCNNDSETQARFRWRSQPWAGPAPAMRTARPRRTNIEVLRSEEHTSELQSLRHLVCRLLLEKKKKNKKLTKQKNNTA